jgi:hypothetical protein
MPIPLRYDTLDGCRMWSTAAPTPSGRFAATSPSRGEEMLENLQ